MTTGEKWKCLSKTCERTVFWYQNFCDHCRGVKADTNLATMDDQTEIESKCLSKTCDRIVPRYQGLCDPCCAKVKANADLATAVLTMVLVTIHLLAPSRKKEMTLQFFLMPDDCLDKVAEFFLLREPLKVSWISIAGRGADYMMWMAP